MWVKENKFLNLNGAYVVKEYGHFLPPFGFACQNEGFSCKTCPAQLITMHFIK
jgi:hypothetical protein